MCNTWIKFNNFIWDAGIQRAIFDGGPVYATLGATSEFKWYGKNQAALLESMRKYVRLSSDSSERVPALVALGGK